MSPSPSVRMQIETFADLTIVRFQDTKILDEIPIMQMGQQLLELVEKKGCRKVLLNFEKVGALSSAAIGKLIHLHKRLVEELGGKLVMCSIKEYLFEALRLLHLDRRFVTAPDEAAALQLF